METEKMGSVMMGGIGIMMALSIGVGMIAAYTPSLEYVCPICGERFATKDALYNHFITEHPTEPIDIIWE